MPEKFITAQSLIANTERLIVGKRDSEIARDREDIGKNLMRLGFGKLSRAVRAYEAGGQKELFGKLNMLFGVDLYAEIKHDLPDNEIDVFVGEKAEKTIAFNVFDRSRRYKTAIKENDITLTHCLNLGFDDNGGAANPIALIHKDPFPPGDDNYTKVELGIAVDGSLFAAEGKFTAYLNFAQNGKIVLRVPLKFRVKMRTEEQAEDAYGVFEEAGAIPAANIPDARPAPKVISAQAREFLKHGVKLRLNEPGEGTPRVYISNRAFRLRRARNGYVTIGYYPQGRRQVRNEISDLFDAGNRALTKAEQAYLERDAFRSAVVFVEKSNGIEVFVVKRKRLFRRA